MAELGLAGRIIASDSTWASPACRMADVGEVVPRVSDEAYLPALRELVARHRVGLVVPLTDLDLMLLARCRDSFAAKGVTVMVGSEKAVGICRNKGRTARLVESLGLATIRTRSVEEFRGEPFYPCFVKPISGSGGVGTALVGNEEELAEHLARHGANMICQEYVKGQEFTIDVYRSRDGQVRCVVPRQRLSVRSGEVEKGVTVRDQALIDGAARLVGALDGLWGVVCCQCRRDAQGCDRFFEINPRFGGGSPLAITAGANLPLYLLQEVLGEPITASLGSFTDRLLMLRYDEAVYLQVDDISKLPGHDTPSFR